METLIERFVFSTQQPPSSKSIVDPTQLVESSGTAKHARAESDILGGNDMINETSNRIPKVKNGRAGSGNGSGPGSFGSIGKHPRSGIVNDKKVENGSVMSMEGKSEQVKTGNSSKMARDIVLNAKKSSGSRFDILSEEVDVIMTEE
ncbi:hypothetical protein Q3G72_032106 [Acer saccharum]|nr:hypothetical protein Q3G72_032106 [Acer saccharum]